MEDEHQRWAELREIKRRRLHELDKQAALRGEAGTPPEVAIERAKLQKELSTTESIMRSPYSSDFVEELGQSGRYMAYQAELKRANDGIAMLGERLDAFIAVSGEWRAMHRQWLLIIGVAVVIILVIVVAIVTWLAARGGV